MTIRSIAASLALLPVFLTLSVASRASAQTCHHCQKTVFYTPKKPRVQVKRICPKPIGPCGEVENFGFFPTCWHPWPFPPNYSHCPGPMPPVPIPAPNTRSSSSTSEELPAPEQLPREPSQPNNVPSDKKPPEKAPSDKKLPEKDPSDKKSPNDVPSDKKPPATSPSPG